MNGIISLRANSQRDAFWGRGGYKLECEPMLRTKDWLWLVSIGLSVVTLVVFNS